MDINVRDERDVSSNQEPTMRLSTRAGSLVSQLSTDVSYADHERVRQYAKRRGKSVQQLLREWIGPKLKMVRKEQETDRE
jgi:hypothetical protein